MQLLRILCKCEDFYKLRKHNYYPKKINNHYDILLAQFTVANIGLHNNFFFKKAYKQNVIYTTIFCDNYM